MKVLITGVTSRMIGSTRLRYDYLSNVSLIKKALELSGHEVEVRKVSVEETDVADKYDCALVGLAHIYSLGAGYYPEATNILAKFQERAALYCDDWACVGLGETLRGVLRGWDRYLNWRKYPHDKYYLDQMQDVIEGVVRGSAPEYPGSYCQWPMLLPIFSWGDVREFMRDNLQFHGQILEGFDPTSLYETPSFEGTLPSRRYKQWTLAVLQNHDQWLKKLGLEWPVITMGNKRKGEPVLPESKVVQAYANSWGVMAPKYPKAGTGWWRVRYVHAADTRSIMLCDPEDGKHIGPSFEIPAHMIEKMSTVDLCALSENQRNEFYSHVPSPDKVAAQVNAFIGQIL